MTYDMLLLLLICAINISFLSSWVGVASFSMISSSNRLVPIGGSGNDNEIPGIWKVRFSDGVWLPHNRYVDKFGMLVTSPSKDNSLSSFPLSSDPFDSSSTNARKVARSFNDNESLNDDDDNVNEMSRVHETDEVLIKICQDGTFRQCNEGYMEGCWMSGRWKRVTDNDDDSCSILFALDRQYYGANYDILLSGTLGGAHYHDDFSIISRSDSKNDFNSDIGFDERNVDTNVVSDEGVTIAGNVWTGKFMYPKNHPSFFDQQTQLVSSVMNGTFIMQRAVSIRSLAITTSTNSHQSEAQNNRRKETQNSYVGNETIVNNNLKRSDFYERKFILTIEPIRLRSSASTPQQQRNSAKDKRSNDDDDIVRNQPTDFRAMLIVFHRNDTFQAFGINKIMRGRFGVQPRQHKYDTIQNNDMNEIWFQVSLFGSGRSAPGSVYSEGIGLSHEDQCTYIGEIMEQNNRLYISGSVLFGSDLGTDARMEPVGKFLLTELTEMPNNRENKQAFLSNESLSDDISNINHINRQDELDSVFE